MNILDPKIKVAYMPMAVFCESLERLALGWLLYNSSMLNYVALECLILLNISAKSKSIF